MHSRNQGTKLNVRNNIIKLKRKKIEIGRQQDKLTYFGSQNPTNTTQSETKTILDSQSQSKKKKKNVF